ncbi:MAG: hypothetical protein ACYTFA_09670 [Planctomycetota bacterium]|jgi:DNA-directed RNA polymerase subunit RPC12/RpoP
MSKAQAAHHEGLYRDAVEAALSSWEYIDGMMQYERRYEEKEFDGIKAIDMVLKYAPLVLDFHSLDKLESLLKNQRRIEKNTSESLAERLTQARALMWDAHRMWDHLEQHGEARQDKLSRILGGEQDKYRSVAETWEKMGLLQRTPEGGSYRLALSTRMGEVVSGKCPSCGAVAEAPKSMFLEEMRCPDCRVKVLFVLLPKGGATVTKE